MEMNYIEVYDSWTEYSFCMENPAYQEDADDNDSIYDNWFYKIF